LLDWILRHISGLLDWLAVFLAVYLFVFLIQFVMNFLDGPKDRKK